MRALHTLTIAEAARLIESRAVSPVELTRVFLDRIAALDATYRSYVRQRPEAALEDARAAESEIAAGRYRGPLHGIPVALKDIIDTAGIGTEAGSALLRGRVPAADARCWAGLRAAGAILLGKLETHEFAVGGPRFHADGGVHAANPWNPRHYMGGSSSGPASAVAAGLCMGTVGTDTAGSIRVPAAYCGLFGLKPTYGLVGLGGVWPLSHSVDHCGPMTWTAEDAALMLAAMAGPDPADPASLGGPVPDYAAGLSEGLTGLRIGFARHWSHEDLPADPQVNAALDAAAAAFTDLGAEVAALRLPGLAEMTACNTVIWLAEAFAAHRDGLRASWATHSPTLRARLALGALIPASDYVDAQRRRRILVAELAAALSGVDLVLAACVPTAAPALSAVAGPAHTFGVVSGPAFDAPFNLVGAPAASVCCGFDRDGLPLALQLAALPGRDAVVLRAAHAYERATPWRSRRPVP